MPAPTSALPFAVKAPSPSTAPGGAASANEAGANKPAFDDMVRRPAKRDDAPRATHTRGGEAKEPVRQGPETAVRKQDPTTRKATGQDAPDDSDAVPTLPPVLTELPALVALPPDGTATTATDPLAAPLPGNPLQGDLLASGAAPAAAVATDAPRAGDRAALPVSLPGTSAGGITTAPGADSGPDNVEPTTTTTATTPAPAAADTKAPLQNVLSFAAHLASGQIAAAVPDAIPLGRELVDAFRSEDGDATAPTANVLAGVGASNAPLGLSRTETVNPMQAPSADLHGGHFDDDIGDAVRWMADQKIGHAHIKVTPNDLGTVEIRLRLDGDRVHADFTSAQADVRQALESSLPRLRDMLGQHGFQLAHADVGQQHAPPSKGNGSRAGDGTGHAGEPAAEAPRTVRMTARGLVDAYA